MSEMIEAIRRIVDEMITRVRRYRASHITADPGKDITIQSDDGSTTISIKSGGEVRIKTTSKIVFERV
jgi:hypothetical protein